jgi:hypothetical protein
MKRVPEAVTGKTLVGFAVLAVVLGLIAAPIALWVGRAGQPTVVRLTTAFFCAIIAYRLTSVIKAIAFVGRDTSLDIALQPRVETAQVDPLLAQLANEMRQRFGLRIVTSALWERVLRLSLQRGVIIADQPVSRRTAQEVKRIIQDLEDAT